MLYTVWNVSVPSKKKNNNQRDRKCRWLDEGKTKRHLQSMREEMMITSALSRSSDFHIGSAIISLHGFGLVNSELKTLWYSQPRGYEYSVAMNSQLWLCRVTERPQKWLVWRLLLCIPNKSCTEGTLPSCCRWQSRKQVNGVTRQWFTLPVCSLENNLQYPHFLSRS